ncbi:MULTISPECIES: hypothetical protein [unclassified Streptomyces]|uniref:hypothetical protein n=1 Tax=unclassified Streptomyces TaxID=2593676 RepID=UPI002250096F|nr:MULTISPECIES: hypothetical protein [unclassified Streptomyces]MCX4398631.1 hypothetical protein [Streptomyces sp. NBC_01767]WSP52283.1 hypothetical protein OG348_36590 [Streptomyces sp. NBC_01243]
MMLRNLRSIASNYVAAGTVRLVLAGVIEAPEDRKLCSDAIGIELSACRLHADLPVIHQRLMRRHENEPEALRWHLARAGELAGILKQAAVDDFTVDATTRPLGEVAADVIGKAGGLCAAFTPASDRRRSARGAAAQIVGRLQLASAAGRAAPPLPATTPPASPGSATSACSPAPPPSAE